MVCLEDADSGEADSGEADSARVDSEDISDLEGVMEAPTGFRQEGCEVSPTAAALHIHLQARNHLQPRLTEPVRGTPERDWTRCLPDVLVERQPGAR